MQWLKKALRVVFSVGGGGLMIVAETSPDQIEANVQKWLSFIGWTKWAEWLGPSADNVVLILGAVLLLGAFLWWLVERRWDHVPSGSLSNDRKLKLSFSPHESGCVRKNTKVWPIATSQPGVFNPSSASNAISYTTVTPQGASYRTTGPNEPPPLVGTYYRIKAEADAVAEVRECRGRLLAMTLDGRPTLTGEPITLPFAPAEASDAAAKRISRDTPEYLDFLVIVDSGEVYIPTHNGVGSSSIDWKNLFVVPGVYQFEIRVTYLNGSSRIIKPALKWTGDIQTAEVSCRAENI